MMTLHTLAVWFGHFADLVSKALNYPREDPCMVMGSNFKFNSRSNT